MIFRQAISELGWELRNLDVEATIAIPAIDTRKMKSGELFWALKGERDGGEFALEAIAKGAQAVVVDRQRAMTLPADIPVVIVNDTLQALTDLGALARRDFKGKVLSLTGSCGKTTVKELIASVLENKYRVLKNQGSFNNHIGVPFTLCQLDERWDFAVLEIGANHPGEIASLCQIAKPNAGLITMVGRAHLEGFGNITGVAKAKGELFRNLYGEKIAFVNFDDPYVLGQSQVCPHRIGYGFEIPATSESFARIYKGVEIDSQSFETMKQRYTFPYPSYLKSLALSAVAVGHFYGIEPRQIAQILADFEGVPGRMRKMEKQGLNIYDDTYNSNPSSLKSALEFLASFKGGKRFAVLGDMMELGEFASEEHRSAIELCRKLELDGWFTQGKCFADILLSNNFLDSSDIVEALLKMVRPRDVVLFKGSRAMKMETVLKLFLERLERI